MHINPEFFLRFCPSDYRMDILDIYLGVNEFILIKNCLSCNQYMLDFIFYSILVLFLYINGEDISAHTIKGLNKLNDHLNYDECASSPYSNIKSLKSPRTVHYNCNYLKGLRFRRKRDIESLDLYKKNNDSNLEDQSSTSQNQDSYNPNSDSNNHDLEDQSSTSDNQDSDYYNQDSVYYDQDLNDQNSTSNNQDSDLYNRNSDSENQKSDSNNQGSKSFSQDVETFDDFDDEERYHGKFDSAEQSIYFRSRELNITGHLGRDIFLWVISHQDDICGKDPTINSFTEKLDPLRIKTDTLKFLKYIKSLIFFNQVEKTVLNMVSDAIKYSLLDSKTCNKHENPVPKIFGSRLFTYMVERVPAAMTVYVYQTACLMKPYYKDATVLDVSQEKLDLLYGAGKQELDNLDLFLGIHSTQDVIKAINSSIYENEEFIEVALEDASNVTNMTVLCMVERLVQEESDIIKNKKWTLLDKVLLQANIFVSCMLIGTFL